MMTMFARWCEGLPFAIAIRESQWLFPIIEGVHLLALALLGGTVLLLDLRLLGVGLGEQTPLALERAVRPWRRGALVAIVVSGLLLFAPAARGYVVNPPFRLKLVALVVAIAFAAAAKRPPLLAAAHSRAQRVVGAVSIALWTIVGVAGRGIGFW